MRATLWRANLFLVIWSTVAWLAGCMAGVATGPPDEALRAYVDAVQTQDAERVHTLLNDETQALESRERLASLIEENSEELTEQTRELTEIVAGGIEARAELRLDNHELAVLVLEDGEWRIDGGILGAPTLRTPQDTVLALRAALVRRSLTGALRVLARDPRAELEADIQSLLEDTEDALGMDVAIEGNSARVRLPSGRELLLVREAGEWRIQEL